MMRRGQFKARASISLLAILIAGTGLMLFVPGHDAQAQEASQTDRKVLYWRSPMDATFISEKPGKDAMGMDLVPVYEGEESAGPPGTVIIDATTMQNIGVKTARVERKTLSRQIRTVGRVAYDETRMRTISPKVGGWVERQYVNYPGQVVEKGERLLEIYSPELVSSQEEYLLAQRYRDRLAESQSPDAVERSTGLAEAATARLKYWDISDSQIETLRERGEISRTMALHAPFKGIVVSKDILEGGFVNPGQSLYRLADISNVWVYADIFEYEAPWLALGQAASMSLAYQPGITYHGTVTYIYPYLKNQTRTLQVRIEFKNTPDFALKPDMWSDIVLETRSREALAVPIQAVLRTGTRDLVLIALDGGRFEPRSVEIGVEADGVFEITSGLEENERVVTSAQFLINSESSLKSAVSKMLNAKGKKVEDATGLKDARPTPEDGGIRESDSAPIDEAVKMDGSMKMDDHGAE